MNVIKLLNNVNRVFNFTKDILREIQLINLHSITKLLQSKRGGPIWKGFGKHLQIRCLWKTPRSVFREINTTGAGMGTKIKTTITTPILINWIYDCPSLVYLRIDKTLVGIILSQSLLIMVYPVIVYSSGYLYSPNSTHNQLKVECLS